MTAPARLLALRLQGFKSFGERTLVEFGPGISAVVGPNGSGKSNLADALRWALGEQGRALRLRKSEDVIFAGSDKRSAVGMADVTLVFGNSDRLLPIDFDTVELGRRLFRSGENDYLLNKQRVRLKDLVDLLDAAIAAMPSSRPTNPIFSFVVAFTPICFSEIPSATAMRFFISAMCG